MQSREEFYWRATLFREIKGFSPDRKVILFIVPKPLDGLEVRLDKSGIPKRETGEIEEDYKKRSLKYFQRSTAPIRKYLAESRIEFDQTDGIVMALPESRQVHELANQPFIERIVTKKALRI